jgi:hypothetical protein
VVAVSPVTFAVNVPVPVPAVTFVHPVPPIVGSPLCDARLYTTPRSDTVAPPVDVTLPPSVALVAATSSLVGVVTVGATAVTVPVTVFVTPAAGNPPPVNFTVTVFVPPSVFAFNRA